MPDAGRPDYNQMAHFTGLEPGEPYFLLRGRDPNAAGAVRAWVALSHDAGVAPSLLERALQHADRIDSYGPKRLPQGTRVEEPEARQLSYAFSRRAFAAMTETPSDEIMLAERRGLDAALGKVRPLITALLAAATVNDDGTITLPAAAGSEGGGLLARLETLTNGLARAPTRDRA